jgi:cupin fold WbuC family metalloprotein
MTYKYVTEDVLYTLEPIVKVDRDTIAFLESVAKKSSRRQSRLCTHSNESDKVHEMLIIHEKDIYVRPHKHLSKSESFHIMQGEVDIVLFDASGEITSVIELGEYNSGKPFYYRFNIEVYHTVMIISDVAVFHETTLGPFNPEETVYASWAPSVEETSAIKQYIENLKQLIDQRGFR